PRFADQDPRAMAEALRECPDPLADGGQQISIGALGRRADAGGSAIVAEHLPQRCRPLAGGGTGLRRLDRRRHDVRRLVACRVGKAFERLLRGGLVALRLPPLERLAALALDLGVRGEDAAVGARSEWRV